ncbi:FMN-dependent NADH-azoreductase [Tepidibacter hydrothermalis]|uniref:FMN dependent NADH:quinone oxidoreductase n=1 Tax=Tepidibacter hydrothermalis TaxID=3036126 RepID=A0ABY8E910_9FIRM|nr:FMN-dependent NADH-azoreductase [Tepidibacter hydrothermalis]WFD09367.1 FMN-dependent NADH-azoreductase [Tepidibacter hydrothermalis]
MSKILYITANPKSEENSFSLSAGSEFINLYKEQNPNDEIVEIDVYNSDIPLIDKDVLSGWNKIQSGSEFTSLSDEEQRKVSRINELTDEFINADKYIFVTPLWNFSLPPMMKAYIDTICIAGKTFKYTENGSVGLLNNKKALHIQAMGGMYEQAVSNNIEFGNTYMKAIIPFLGVEDVSSILIDGTSILSKDQVQSSLYEEIKKMANSF